MIPTLIDTDRLRLRPWENSDVDDILAYAQDEEWSRYLRLLPRPYTRRDAREFVARQGEFDRLTRPSWAIVLDGRVIGGVNLRLDLANRLGEIGYSVARSHWNHGYCTEAVRAVIAEAFASHPDLNRIRAFADVRNTASQRVMVKVGMQKEGMLRQNRIERGEPIDEAWFGILRSEWPGLGQIGGSAPA